MSRARAVHAATAPPVFSDGGTLRWASGSGNAGASVAAVVADIMPKPGAAEPAALLPVELPQAETDDAWAKAIRQREAADSDLREREVARAPMPPPRAAPSEYRGNPGRAVEMGPLPSPSTADLSALPDRFTFEVERKPDGWWVVRAPAVHIGLFVAHRHLGTALTDAPSALAEIVRLDGVVPRGKRGRRTA